VCNRVQLRREAGTTLNVLYYVVADSFHLVMFEGSCKSAPLPFDRPFADSLIDQKMEQRIISRGYGTSKTGLLGIGWFLIREIVGLLSRSSGKGIGYAQASSRRTACSDTLLKL